MKEIPERVTNLTQTMVHISLAIAFQKISGIDEQFVQLVGYYERRIMVALGQKMVFRGALLTNFS